LGVTAPWIVHAAVAKLDEQADLTPDLIAGLSLWMYSLACGDKSMNRFYNLDRAGGSDEPCSQSLFPGRKDEHFIRILGNTRSQGPFYMDPRFMESWIGLDQPFERFPEDGLWRRPWPLFGLYYSASFE